MTSRYRECLDLDFSWNCDPLVHYVSQLSELAFDPIFDAGSNKGANHRTTFSRFGGESMVSLGTKYTSVAGVFFELIYILIFYNVYVHCCGM